MQDLRLVGVHDDGKHLLLSGAGGEMFQLPIDEALRAAASRSPGKAAASAAAAPVAMSPRDIQARIRSGATAAEVSELSGIPLAKVQRYEGPVLAEREYVAQQARKVEVASPAPGHDAYRSAFGDNPASLGEMVAHRLTAHGIEASSVEWDSWRRPDGSWTVVARFEARPGGYANIGEEPPAMWTFNPARKSLHNANRWAQQLSELELMDGPVPARRLTAVSDRPFDFETDAEAAAARTASGTSGKDPDGLLDMLRSRRGQRLGVDEDADDALALLLTNGVPAAHPRPSEVEAQPEPEATQPVSAEAGSEEEGAPAAEVDTLSRKRESRASVFSRLSLAPRRSGDEEDLLKLHDGVSTDTREITIVASQLRPVLADEAKIAQTQADQTQPGPTKAGRAEAAQGRTGQSQMVDSDQDRDQGSRNPALPAREGSPNVGLDELLGGGGPRRRADATAAGRGERDPEQPERQPSKPKRSSVPSWDEIVFGARGD
jgi:hypothetical protein